MTARLINRLTIMLITAILMLLSLANLNLSPVRLLFAIGLVTILPGYALTSAVFVNTPLGLMEKVAFSFGFSLGMTALGGILLNYTRWGVQSVSWLILLGGSSILASILALTRMKDPVFSDFQAVQIHTRFDQIILMVLSGVIIVGAYVYARIGAQNSSSPPSTRIWVLWADELESEVILGIENQTNVQTAYRLQVSTLGGQAHEWPMITLASGEIWTTYYKMPATVAENDFIKATLYRIDRPAEIFREVYLRRTTR